MKKISFLLLVPILFLAKDPDRDQLKKDVYTLSDDSMEGREAGTKFEIMTIEFLEKRFKEIGLEPRGTDQYRQKFKAQQKGIHGENEDMEVNVSNVIGFIDNKAENTIIIGAHFDHLGWGSRSSLSQSKGIHRGADDNASGVATMLQLAEVLKQEKNLKNNLLFIGFTGEEKGLWGSNYFTKNPTIDLYKTNFMINLDMVGRLNKNKILISGTGTSSVWDKILDEKKSGFEIIKNESGIGPSDYSSFYMKNIPVLHFFTGQHSDYHKISDTPDKINYDGMVEITNFIKNIIIYTDENYSKIDFKKTKDESDKKISFNVTLGVMPDYLYSQKGMRIDGVKDEKPAHKAGIIAGDIVIKMGEYQINDMKDYMKCLSVFNKGDKINVLIKRGDKELKKEVQF